MLRQFLIRCTNSLKVSSTDELMKAISIDLSRRKFLQGILAGSVAIGIQSFNVLPVMADICNKCWSSCDACSASTGSCCSPNGQYCYSCSWSCPSCQCGCPGNLKWTREIVCNSGGHSCSVSCCGT